MAALTPFVTTSRSEGTNRFWPSRRCVATGFAREKSCGWLAALCVVGEVSKCVERRSSSKESGGGSIGGGCVFSRSASSSSAAAIAASAAIASCEDDRLPRDYRLLRALLLLLRLRAGDTAWRRLC